MGLFNIKYPIPLKYRRGGLRNNPVALILSGLTNLHYIDSIISGSLGDKDILDFGCGVKFTQAIIQFDIDIKSYTGIDVYQLMINYLNNTVSDSRFTYYSVDFHNDMYRPQGKKMTPDDRLPLGRQKFDLITLQSVITHCNPDDSFAVLSILKRYLRKKGELFLTVRIDDDQDVGFRDADPEHPMLFATYRKETIERIILESGYRIKFFGDRDDAIPVQAHYLLQHV